MDHYQIDFCLAIAKPRRERKVLTFRGFSLDDFKQSIAGCDLVNRENDTLDSTDERFYFQLEKALDVCAPGLP